ncbi:TetR/AcrR family transcriptional regulator [Amycolatopsis decaplanina]|uniref:TetR family transcriptional regulator n=1 Tax=Amycolatopsis decaplanina DSM 44594 TaxID=1284240 RepID=M2ZQP1_9PSEU|nr:TetR/AcrR family transcriptional regulator [Amycolatopsis decaplanina]EME62674.1 TetR family transcriptional regulator [Amycolatopsis decaplanina DSM 44594]
MEQETGVSSRERILRAAMAMFGEDPAARLSVRAVAARAGVSTGSLRYHFPTQRALQDTVLAGIYDAVAPGDRIHDRSVPARERLADCLRQVLALAGVGEQARAAWGEIFTTYIEREPTDENRAAYLAIDREAQRRVEYWLTVLGNEGALAEGDNRRRARFLVTVLNGLSIQRALPSEESILTTETETLHAAVDHVLNSRF